MGLKDRAVRWLAMRWLRGKVKDWRKGGSAMWSFMDGRKRLLVVLAFLVASLVKKFTGVDLSQWVTLGVGAVGWDDPIIVDYAIGFAAEWGLEIAGAIAAIHTLIKHYRQRKAGATLSEVGSPEGAVKLAMENGTVWKMINDAKSGEAR